MLSQYRTTILNWSVISLIVSFRCILLASVGMIPLLPRSAAAQDAGTVDVSTTPMHLICVTDTWAVWTNEQLLEETRRKRAESFVHTYYRQRLSEPKASLAATVNETRVGFVTSIMQDGTLVLCHRDRLSLYLPDGGDKELSRTPAGRSCLPRWNFVAGYNRFGPQAGLFRSTARPHTGHAKESGGRACRRSARPAQ